MCLIVDANLASLVFGENPNDDFRPIIDWLNQKNGKFVLGGHLAVEYNRIASLRSHIIELWRKGIARIIPSDPINEEEKRIANSCRSDDPHVIALAKVSGARILCSNDKDLREDFRNPKLISNPQGHIYQNAKHKHLLSKYGHTIACGQGKF